MPIVYTKNINRLVSIIRVAMHYNLLVDPKGVWYPLLCPPVTVRFDEKQYSLALPFPYYATQIRDQVEEAPLLRLLGTKIQK